ncbi:hypothetical protein [Bradyrhizobium vignae]|uniref:Uncharacterized protein n=1 Tax=Bradyrhizobium vignae TaxID=1549949 RepID=A0A2U3PW47_9BRAD|nr:hypothetical protein [Bradyrhizobium vignae]SPP93380.1 protein of unknown function [Bradyrhizobium vignae]
MTPALLIARNCIIYWVNVWIARVECVSPAGFALEEFDRLSQAA